MEAIRAAGLDHVAFLSNWGSELSDKKDTIYGCYLMETLLNNLPDLNVVHVRAVWFMDNFIYSILLMKMAGINGLSIDPNFAFPRTGGPAMDEATKYLYALSASN